MKRWVGLVLASVTLAAVVSASAVPFYHPEGSQPPRDPVSVSVPRGGAMAPVTSDRLAGAGGTLLQVSADRHVPHTETSIRGWSGLNSTAACGDPCETPNPAIASGNDYVIEAAGSSFRIWTSQGTLLENASLGSPKLFDSDGDVIRSPEFYYDPSTLRWFAAAVDLTRGQVDYAASASSDPTGPWYFEHFSPMGASEDPSEPALSVSSANLVVTLDVSRGAALVGAEIYVANKSQLLAGEAPATWSSSLGPSNESVVPAQSIGTASETYLVTDREGGEDLNVTTLSGSPPSTPTLSAPSVWWSPTASPPPAVQSGSSDLVNTGTAQVSSAAWEGGDLWAVADVACVPSGDSVERACLHLWEISPGAGGMSQDFNWSTGPGTYDYRPSLSVDLNGNLAIVFESSSSTTNPSVLTTAQAAVDPRGTLESPLILRPGGGPDNLTAACPDGLCPFGNSSSASIFPLTGGEFWLAGEYTGADRASVPWHTWVDEVSVVPTYPVNLSEANLPAGMSWSVSVNGAEQSSSSPTIQYNETNGTFTFAVASPLQGDPGVQYAASPASGTFSVSGGAANDSINFTEQFELNSTVTPDGAGTVSPTGGWFNASSPIDLTALAGPGYVFSAWSGSGTGSYSGASDPASVQMLGPITESAIFSVAVTYPVSFEESGLPDGTVWSVVLNGVSNTSDGSTVFFYEPNGSFSFLAATLLPGATGARYAASPSSGSFDLSGSGTSIGVSYVAEFALTTSVSPSGSGWISPALGWFNSTTPVALNALAGAGHAFSSWIGTGPGAYTGTANPAPVTLTGPILEEAVFSTATTYPVTFVQAGLPEGANWSVAVNGVTNVSSAATMVFNEPNGTYSFDAQSVVPGGPGVEYVAGIPSGNFTIEGIPVPEAVGYLPEFEVDLTVSPAGEGTIGTSSGWYSAGSVVNLSAIPAEGYRFIAWQGSGAGSYTGTLDPAAISVEGPISEAATFSSSTGPTASSPAPSPPTGVPAWELVLALTGFGIAVAAVAALAIRSRFLSPPPNDDAVIVPDEPWRE